MSILRSVLRSRGGAKVALTRNEDGTVTARIGGASTGTLAYSIDGAAWVVVEDATLPYEIPGVTFGNSVEAIGSVTASVPLAVEDSDVFLLIGQSNMIGGAAFDSGADYPGNAQQVDQSGALVAASYPLDHYSSTPGNMGLALQFARDHAEGGKPAIFLPRAEGSTGFITGHWGVGGTHYNDVIADTNAFLAAYGNLSLSGILMLMGEQDSTTTVAANAFASNLSDMVAGLRANITGASSVPFVCAQIYITGGAPYPGVSTVRAALADVPNQITNAYFVDTAGLGHVGDGLHYNAVALRAIGQGMLDKLRTPLGLPAVRNLFLKTEDLTDGAWIKSELTITANAAAAPSGGTTADKVVATTATNGKFAYQSAPSITGDAVFSIYAKAAEYDLVRVTDAAGARFSMSFDLTNETVPQSAGTWFHSAGVEDAGDGWKRIWVRYNAAGGVSPSVAGYPSSATPPTHGPVSYTGDGSSGLYIWGAQVEEGTAATTYQRRS